MRFDRLAALVCAAAIAFAAVSAAEAAPGALPVIDLQKRCQNSEKTVIDMMADQTMRGTAFQSCLRAEQQAKDALLSSWKDIPQSYKAYCIRPVAFSPSYIEWIACLELMIDLKKQRATNGIKFENIANRCPAIEYGDDGSIRRVRACSL